MEPWQIIALLGGVVIVVALLQPRKKQQSSKTMQNMETALEQFMENMETDNREMVEMVTKAQKEAQNQAQEREQRIIQLEQRCADLEQTLVTGQSASIPAPAIVNQAVDSGQSLRNAIPETDTGRIATPSVIMDRDEQAAGQSEDTTVRSRYIELFSLHESGKSMETIAKKLGMNKGEVQLILSLAQQEEGVAR